MVYGSGIKSTSKDHFLFALTMKHVPEIDGLRAWMAWWVVCQHILQISGIDRLYPNPLIKLLTMGGLAVIVFVIISGFVIANLIVLRPENYRAYIARRFMRIFPIYIVAVAANWLLQGVYYQTFSITPWSLEGHDARIIGEWENMPLHILLHLTLMHGMVPNDLLQGAVTAILTPAWSLSLEWQYYLAAPFVMSSLFCKSWPHQVTVGVVGLVLMFLAYWHSPLQNWQLPAFLPLLFGFFMLGAASRMWFSDVPRARLALPLFLAGLNIFLYAHSYCGGHLWVAFIPVAIWLLTLLTFGVRYSSASALLLSRIAHRFVGSIAIRKLGTWSYSTYLMHIPLFVCALWLLRGSGLPISQYSYFFTLLLAAILLIPLSWLCYNYIEKPAMILGKRWIDHYFVKAIEK